MLCTRVQARQLRELFEQYSTVKGHLALMAARMGEQWKKSAVASHLKKLGLTRARGGSAAKKTRDELASSSEEEVRPWSHRCAAMLLPCRPALYLDTPCRQLHQQLGSLGCISNE